jgi:hypothetical protein
MAATAAVLGVLALGACGSSSKNASTDKSTTTVAAENVTTTVAAGASAGASLKYCDYSKAAQAASAASGASMADLKTNLEKLRANLDVYASSAPSEIKADVKVYVDDFLKPFMTEMQRVNYDFTKANLSVLQSLATNTKLQAAGQRISAYYAAHCK